MYEAGQANIRTARQSETSPVPREPGPMDRCREMLGYLEELEQLQQGFREKLYGPGPNEKDIGSKPPASCLDDMLLVACQRAAMCVGEAKSLLNRL